MEKRRERSIGENDDDAVVEAAKARYGVRERLRAITARIYCLLRAGQKTQSNKTRESKPGSPRENGCIESWEDKSHDAIFNKSQRVVRNPFFPSQAPSHPIYPSPSPRPHTRQQFRPSLAQGAFEREGVDKPDTQ